MAGQQRQEVLGDQGRPDGVDAIDLLERGTIERAPCLFRMQPFAVV
jgi:hypothetical protein